MAELPRYSLHNVNVAQNRMSAADQLLEINDLTVHRDLITQFLSVELKAVERIHKSLSAGHIAGPALLGKPSALVHATELLKTIRKQVKLLTENNSRLRNLSLPVLRCPSDVLHIIFRFTTSRFSGRNKFRAAIKLSYVSQQWRRAALGMPELWVHTSISPQHTAESAEEYLNWTMERVGTMPLYITIGPAISNLSDLFPPNLIHVVAIDTLTIYLMKSGHLTELLGPRLSIPRCNIGQLCLWDLGAPDQSAAGWDIISFLAKWPPIDDLMVSTDTKITLHRRGDSSKTTKLHLWQCLAGGSISVLALTATFRKLTVLKIDHMEIDTRGLGNTRVIMEALTQVAFGMPMGPIWRYLRCPRLLEVTEKYALKADFLEFLGLHRTIKSLSITEDAFYGERPLQQIATVSPQITTLKIVGSLDLDILFDWREAGLSSPAFPCLESFSLRNAYRFRFKDVESLIRHRCLPSEHIDSLKERGVKAIKFMSFDGERGLWDPNHANRWVTDIHAPDQSTVEMKFEWGFLGDD